MRLASALCLLLSLSEASAFVLPKNAVRRNSPCFAAKKDDDAPKRKQRFAQDAHVPRPRPISYGNEIPLRRPSPSPEPEKVSSDSKPLRSPPTPREPEENRSDNKPLRRSISSPEPKKVNDEFMWRTRKSIDDIESSMTKRFGIESEKWAADPNEYELEDGESDDNFKSKQNSNFRGKAVLDPWQKAEIRARPAPDQPAADRGGVFGSRSTEDVILNRARKNQQQSRQETKTKKPAWADLVEEDDTPGEVNQLDEQDDSSGKIREFDDEDDSSEEGNMFDEEDDEGSKAGWDNGSDTDDYDVGKLISPKPIGGQGSKSAVPSNPGYFFNPNAGIENEERDSSEAQAEPQKRPSGKQNASPLRDEDGNQLYLTVAQAERNFRSTLSSGASDDEDLTAPSTQPTAWDELGITSKQLLKNLQSMGCDAPLSVQEKSCPSILTGNDVMVGTYTGSGKTLAFLVPLAQRLLFEESSPSDGLQVLIVAPGRELASQIASVARSLLEGTGLSVVLAIGGTTFSRNLEQIRKNKPTIVVGTPGRIAELVVGQPGEKIGRLKIASLQSVVLDEFDALLEYKPHRDPTAAIMNALKRRHRDSLQSILCSATASDMVGSAKLENYLRPGYFIAMADKDDQLITAGDDKNAVTRVSRTVIHGVVHLARRQLALSTIRKILHTEPVPQQVLIFADNARRVDLVVEKLAQMGIIAAPLHGGAKSDKMDRAEVSKALREGYVGIVVATELAARGLDAPLLTHVINLDLPTDASHYAHRAGRCGRGGRPGVVINITTGPKERNVPKKFSDKLGVEMFAVEPKGARLTIVDSGSQVIDV